MPPDAEDHPGFVSTALVAILVLGCSFAGHADESCFTERGRVLTANIIGSAVSGRLATSVQGSSWGTRPTVYVIEIGQYGTFEVGSWTPVLNAADIDMAASFAYVTADGGLYALDLRDPSLPSELSFVDLNDSQFISVDTNLAFVTTTGAGGNGWLDVVDLSDPASLARLGGIYWPRPDPPKYAIDTAGGTVVIADAAGLLVIDAGDPHNPFKIGRWVRAEARDVAIVGDHAVLTFAAWAHPGDLGITIVDLSDRSDPSPVGTWNAPSPVLSVAEYGGAVVAGTESHGIYLIDIEDPANPIVIDHWGESGLGAQSVATAWPTVVVTHVELGVAVLGLERSCLPPRRPSGRVVP